MFSSILANELVRAGQEVKLVTKTLSNDPDTFGYEVFRRPSVSSMLKLLRWCDVYLQNHVSLNTAWPLLLVHRPWVVGHHGWLTSDWKGLIKKNLLRFATGISVSQAVAADFPPSVVIQNPYDDLVFYERPGVLRERDLIFVGRLVSDKGAKLLLHAIANLKSSGEILTLTIVGGGPEEVDLKRFTVQHGLSDQVQFAGILQGDDLAVQMNKHRIMVVPSIWQEPFGIVALEGIACGCVIIGSQGGGLTDAIGPCGVTFPNGDVKALTQQILEMYIHPDNLGFYRSNAAAHLKCHTPSAVAQAYLQVLNASYQK
jgi:glycosyltransferase involved in cell wall biosynthesis